MKVHLGKYTSWVGPFQIADALYFWGNKDQRFKLGVFLDDHTPLGDICSAVDKLKKRKVKVQIDKWDAWSADHTLALIIHPLLIEVRKDKLGCGIVEDSDAPEELSSKNAPPVEKWDIDDNNEKRWHYVLDEMIWAFNEVIIEGEDESEYNHEKEKIRQDRMNNGFRLFGKYYRALWT
jgi:hypothetical protein